MAQEVAYKDQQIRNQNVISTANANTIKDSLKKLIYGWTALLTSC